ncbi:MAG: hypothetical protein BHW34_01195 [Firmicutes bacterium CAG:176_59_8]|nr:MAG: hypothetical protein BHW34_01195 [Firmicutes bacterium CAG:176_59_8]
MSIGNQIMSIRRERQLTQEQFGSLFHVTRQTVSNWENGKSYPDLQLLVAISDQFGISLDTLLKEDTKMVKAIDRERVMNSAQDGDNLLLCGQRHWTGNSGACTLRCLNNLLSGLVNQLMIVTLDSDSDFVQT